MYFIYWIWICIYISRVWCRAQVPCMYRKYMVGLTEGGGRGVSVIPYPLFFCTFIPYPSLFWQFIPYPLYFTKFIPYPSLFFFNSSLITFLSLIFIHFYPLSLMAAAPLLTEITISLLLSCPYFLCRVDTIFISRRGGHFSRPKVFPPKFSRKNVSPPKFSRKKVPP